MSAVLNNMKLRKAAILVASLDTSTADAILGQMAEEQAAQVRRMMVEPRRNRAGRTAAGH